MTGVIIAISVILVFILLLLCPISVSYSYDTEQHLSVKYLFIKKEILPIRKKSAGKKTELSSKPKSNNYRRKKSNLIKNTISDLKHIKSELSFSELISLAVYILKKCCLALKRLCKAVVIKKFSLFAKISADNAADTAVKYGKYNAYIYTTLKFFDHYFSFKDMNVEIVPDFNNHANQYKFDIEVSVSVLILIIISAAFLISLIKLYFKLKKQTKNTVRET